MNINHCSRCGSIFSTISTASEICPSCQKQSEESYRKIFEYFKTQPTATADEIAKETGVDTKEIYRFVRENRLRLVKMDTGQNCEKCGGPIFGGKFAGKLCDKCRSQIVSDLQKDFQKSRNPGVMGSPKAKPTSSKPFHPGSTHKKH